MIDIDGNTLDLFGIKQSRWDCLQEIANRVCKRFITEEENIQVVSHCSQLLA